MAGTTPTAANSSILSVWLLAILYLAAGAAALWFCTWAVLVDGAPGYVLAGSVAGLAAIAGAFLTARLAVRRRRLGR